MNNMGDYNMGKLLFYSNYMDNIRTSPKTQWKNQQQAFIDEMFENSTINTNDLFQEGFPFDFEFVDNPLCWVGTVLDVETGITKNSDDYRSLYFKDINRDARRGQYFKWNDNYWIVYETTTDLETISTCNIRRCNNWMKWISDTGEVIQYPCVIDDILTSANAQVAKSITQSNGHIDVYVQANEHTLALTNNTRIIFNGKPYKLYAINNYRNNDFVKDNPQMLYLDFYLDMLTAQDNIEENIADDIRDKFSIVTPISDIKITTNDEDNVIEIPIMSLYNGNEVFPQYNITMPSELSERFAFTYNQYKNLFVITVNTFETLTEDIHSFIQLSIKNNSKSTVTIPITIYHNDIIDNQSIIAFPNVKTLNQGDNVVLKTICMKYAHKIDDVEVEMIPSGASQDCYTIESLATNEWKITNKKFDNNSPLKLQFTSEDCIPYEMEIQLKPMF